MQQLARDVVALGVAQLAQGAEQGLQGVGQPVFTGQGVDQAVEHLVPGRVQVLACGHQGHAVLLGAGLDVIGQGGHGYAGHSLALGVHDLGHEQQVVGNRVALGQLAQPGGAFGEQRGGGRREHPGEAGVVQGFDVTGLKNALHEEVSQKAAAGAPTAGARRQ